MNDIETRDDIRLLVTEFYGKVLKDELLSPVFRGIHLPDHFPVMIDFWASVLLGEKGYTGNPFVKHVHLPIGSEHFERWLTLFGATIGEHFSGPVSTEAKNRATTIGGIFRHKLGLM